MAAVMPSMMKRSNSSSDISSEKNSKKHQDPARASVNPNDSAMAAARRAERLAGGLQTKKTKKQANNNKETNEVKMQLDQIQRILNFQRRELRARRAAQREERVGLKALLAMQAARKAQQWQLKRRLETNKMATAQATKEQAQTLPPSQSLSDMLYPAIQQANQQQQHQHLMTIHQPRRIGVDC